jgi:hypothetical protein
MLKEPAMRSMLFGILALLALIVVSALGALPSAYAQGGAKNQGSVRQAPVGHRQPTTRDVPNDRQSTSADDAMKKIDDNLKKKLGGICHGC